MGMLAVLLVYTHTSRLLDRRLWLALLLRRVALPIRSSPGVMSAA